MYLISINPIDKRLIETSGIKMADQSTMKSKEHALCSILITHLAGDVGDLNLRHHCHPHFSSFSTSLRLLREEDPRAS